MFKQKKQPNFQNQEDKVNKKSEKKKVKAQEGLADKVKQLEKKCQEYLAGCKERKLIIVICKKI